jgi:hypothetical protein
MTAVIRFLTDLGPLFFGIGFLAPLITQIIELQQWSTPLGMNPLWFGLALGTTLGLVANVRGRWV